MPRFGEYLVENNIITSEQLEKALVIQREENELGYHRMIGYILLNEFKSYSKADLHRMLQEWKEKENGNPQPRGSKD